MACAHTCPNNSLVKCLDSDNPIAKAAPKPAPVSSGEDGEYVTFSFPHGEDSIICAGTHEDLTHNLEVHAEYLMFATIRALTSREAPVGATLARAVAVGLREADDGEALGTICDMATDVCGVILKEDEEGGDEGSDEGSDDDE